MPSGNLRSLTRSRFVGEIGLPVQCVVELGLCCLTVKANYRTNELWHVGQAANLVKVLYASDVCIEEATMSRFLRGRLPWLNERLL